MDGYRIIVRLPPVIKGHKPKCCYAVGAAHMAALFGKTDSEMTDTKLPHPSAKIYSMAELSRNTHGKKSRPPEKSYLLRRRKAEFPTPSSCPNGQRAWRCVHRAPKSVPSPLISHVNQPVKTRPTHGPSTSSLPIRPGTKRAEESVRRVSKHPCDSSAATARPLAWHKREREQETNTKVATQHNTAQIPIPIPVARGEI